MKTLVNNLSSFDFSLSLSFSLRFPSKQILSFPILLALCLSLVLNSADAQKQVPEIQVLNNYINFANESVHGLLIVHRLLELYNQDINKYVDLEGYQLNFYSNSDLPSNIFDDPDNWFYETSPNEWYELIQQDQQVINPEHYTELESLSRQMNNICRAINQIRFSVEEYIQENDLTIPDNLAGVYTRLENAVKMYDDYFDRQVKLENVIKKAASGYLMEHSANSKSKSLYPIMSSCNHTFKEMLRALRLKDEVAFSKHFGQLKNDFPLLSNLLNSLSLDTQKAIFARKKIIEKIDNAIQAADRFINTAEVPVEYRLYGKFYYYHNSDLINKMNRYGNGFTNEMNYIIEEMEIAAVKIPEEPHFYQVIYPEKITKDHAIASSDNQIDLLPVRLKDREVVTNSRTIIVDVDPFEIELFDHMIQDGDIISLNYNGDWILEEYSLEAKPKKLKLKLNEEGANYLLLHAETIGWRPPNTMAVTFYSGGEKQEIILKSDLNESEMIMIEKR